MAMTIDMHDMMLRIIQKYLSKIIKKRVPDCKGFIMFTVSKLDQDPGPRTAILTNMKNYHSCKVLMELAINHMESRTFHGEAAREEDDIWVQCQKTSKKV